MARSVIDLVSSSPPPDQAMVSTRPRCPLSISRPIVFSPDRPSHEENDLLQRPSTGLRFWDDSNKVNNESLDPPDVPQVKRRRGNEPQPATLESLNVGKHAEEANELFMPRFLHEGHPRRTQNAPEAIEITSPLESEPAEKRAIEAQNGTPFTNRAFISCDPLASSSPHVPTQNSSAKVAVCEDAKLFSSSPSYPPQRRAHGRDRLDSSPTASLVCEKRSSDQLFRVPDERTIPYSKPSSKVVFIDDSSTAGDSSIEEELPDIPELKMSESRFHFPSRPVSGEMVVSNPNSLAHAAIPRQGRCNKNAAQRSAERELKKKERERAKAAKTAEKQRAAAVAEVNKLRTDKKVSTPQMIVDLPSRLDSAVQVQIKEMLSALKVDYTCNARTDNIVDWRRRVNSEFNDGLGRWEPIPPKITEERFVLLIVPAEKIAEMALENSLMTHITSIQTQHAGKSVIILVQGIMTWLRKNRNVRNRQFACGVRSDTSDVTATSPISLEYVDENIIEDALLALQIEHQVLIHHTNAAMETARWVVNFTQHISTIPYRKQREDATSIAGFCMETGQVRTGDGAQDTYARLLQEISRVTAPIAYGIEAEFHNVTQLVTGLERGGPTRLADVKKTTNKDGALSDRAIGQAVSRRLHKIFTERSQHSTDI
ncbi:ERCC4 domain protein [Moelleriella libera RCEF 2490]|uniref:ERCC4 domain protein n=1 Tax=Moelleriella libera RCEF 2490 TaxID=1081109 RepID=A0A168EGI4_9HYPO|nr:ERCC4 domain protein [Moelleriella libera RCEF 2490]